MDEIYMACIFITQYFQLQANDWNRIVLHEIKQYGSSKIQVDKEVNLPQEYILGMATQRKIKSSLSLTLEQRGLLSFILHFEGNNFKNSAQLRLCSAWLSSW